MSKQSLQDTFLRNLRCTLPIGREDFMTGCKHMQETWSWVPIISDSTLGIWPNPRKLACERNFVTNAELPSHPPFTCHCHFKIGCQQSKSKLWREIFTIFLILSGASCPNMFGCDYLFWLQQVWEFWKLSTGSSYNLPQSLQSCKLKLDLHVCILILP